MGRCAIALVPGREAVGLFLVKVGTYMGIPLCKRTVVCLLSLHVACSAERESSHKLSELFQVCVPAAPEAKAEIKIPVDVEFTSFTTSKGRIDFVFDQYPIRKDI